MAETNLILASSSPRRKEILSKLGIPFTVIPADIDESTRSDETPSQYVQRLALEKAQKIAKEFTEAVVIGSDLTCDLDGRAIGKANNRAEAETMLTNFSNRVHFGRCGYAVIKGKKVLGIGVASTRVTFKKLTKEQIAKYLDSDQWVGLAGAYGVQNDGRSFLANFQGSYFDILGLPIYEIVKVLIANGFPISVKYLNLIKQQEILNAGKILS